MHKTDIATKLQIFFAASADGIVNFARKGLDDSDAPYLAAAIEVENANHTFDLRNNKFTDAGAVQIAEALGKNKSPKTLKFEGNKEVRDTGVLALNRVAETTQHTITHDLQVGGHVQRSKRAAPAAVGFH